MFRFELIYQSKKSAARVGKIHTSHGVIDTPNFVAVGTNGTLKSLDNGAAEELQLMFCNTYHLLLQPGLGVIQQAGGLHAFIHRTKPIITDSGGFQVFSLAYGSVASELKSQGTKQSEASVLKITEEGVLFRSYRNGEKILLTPESSIHAQKILGADIIIPFDELPPYHISSEALHQSLERTHRWEKRSLEQHIKDPQGQALYSVIHGGIDPELRKKSALFLTNLPFDGCAIGGSLGKSREEMLEMLTHLMPQIPRFLPVHLLGIGDIPSLTSSVPLGIDTFDSSYPTRAARHGVLLTKKGPLKVTKAQNATLFGPIEEGCTCHTCQKFSLAYLHHLFKASETTGGTLASIHNLHFMIKFMERLRHQILDGVI